MYISPELLKRIEPKAKDSILDDIAAHLTQALIDGKINNANRVSHFLAQAAHESAGFSTMREFWGPTVAQKKYENNKNLGNTEPGDGKLFMGRGLFQITGRYNYRIIGKAIGEDLLTDPTVAEQGHIAVKTAVWYWNNRNLSALADADDIKTITKKINGGQNGLADRIQRLAKVRTVITDIMSGDIPTYTPVNPETPKDPIPLIIARKGSSSESVKIIQVSLNHKGYNLDVDGDFGPATDKAVKDFQKKSGLKADGLVNIETYNAILKV